MHAPSTTAGLPLPETLAKLGPTGTSHRATDQLGSETTASAHDTEQLLALLYRQLRALAGPRPDLDDIVQSAAERALRSLNHFEGRSRLSTWVYGVAYRTLLDHDRWYAPLRRRIFYTEELNLPEPHSHLQPEEMVAEVRRAQSLYRALDQLPASKRTVVVLHDIQGLTASEVADVVGANERTVRSRLRDARCRLASLLQQDPQFCSRGPQ